VGVNCAVDAGSTLKHPRKQPVNGNRPPHRPISAIGTNPLAKYLSQRIRPASRSGRRWTSPSALPASQASSRSSRVQRSAVTSASRPRRTSSSERGPSSRVTSSPALRVRLCGWPTCLDGKQARRRSPCVVEAEFARKLREECCLRRRGLALGPCCEMHAKLAIQSTSVSIWPKHHANQRGGHDIGSNTLKEVKKLTRYGCHHRRRPGPHPDPDSSIRLKELSALV